MYESKLDDDIKDYKDINKPKDDDIDVYIERIKNSVRKIDESKNKLNEILRK